MSDIPQSVAHAYRSAPATHRETMLEMRKRILEVIPDASVVMKYGMPTFVHKGHAVAGLLANKKHIGFYPYSGSVLARLPEITSKYFTTKAAVHIPIDAPMPKNLVRLLLRTRISDCPIVQRKIPADEGVWRELGVPGAPARRALVNANIKSLHQLSKSSRANVAALHGMGPRALAFLDALLDKNEMVWKT